MSELFQLIIFRIILSANNKHFRLFYFCTDHYSISYPNSTPPFQGHISKILIKHIRKMTSFFRSFLVLSPISKRVHDEFQPLYP